MIRKNIYALIAMAGLVLATSGCSGFVASGASGGEGGLGLPVDTPADIDLAALDKDLDAVEASMAAVNREIDKIDLPYLTGSSTQQNLAKGLQGLFTKLYLGIEKAYNKVDELKARANAELAKLDPLNPLHLVAILKAQQVLAYLDELKARLGTTISQLVTRVDAVVTKVDAKIASMDPLQAIVVSLIWGQFRVVIMDFRGKLVDLVSP